jgi:hypothetical protein
LGKRSKDDPNSQSEYYKRQKIERIAMDMNSFMGRIGAIKLPEEKVVHLDELGRNGLLKIE